MNRQDLETTLGIQMPINFEKVSLENQSLIVEYLKQLDFIERKAYLIAKDHLGSSFNLVKSNGFLEWKKSI